MSEKKFYRVVYELEVVVAADDLKDAEQVADQAWKQAINDQCGDISTIEPVKALSQLPYGWTGKCYPYSRNGEKDLMLEEMLPPFEGSQK